MRPEISGYAPDGKMTGGMGLGSVRPQQRYSNNPFTYTSTAGASQPVPSFLDLLDQERVKTVEAIVKPVETDKGPSLADTRPVNSNNDNRGQESGTEGGPGGGGSRQTAEGGINTGIGGFSVDPNSNTATPNSIGSVGKGVASTIGGLAFGTLGAAAANKGVNSLNEQAVAAAAAHNAAVAQSEADASSVGGGGTGGQGMTGGMGGSDSASSSGSADAKDSTGGSAGANGGTTDGDARGGGFAKGGKVGLSDVKQFTAGGPNAPGIDDGLVNTGVGDFILTAERTAHFGDDLLKALAEGRAEIVMTGEAA